MKLSQKFKLLLFAIAISISGTAHAQNHEWSGDEIIIDESGEVTIQDDNVDFGKVKAGNSKTKEWSVKNKSGTNLYVKTFNFLAGVGYFAKGSSVPIPPGSKFKINFTFYKPFGTTPGEFPGRFMLVLWDQSSYYRTYDIKLKTKLVP